MAKYVYSFGGGTAEGAAGMKELLGGKGANLAEMTNLGIPVPPGFTITTEVCDLFYKNGRQYPEGLKQQVDAAIDQLERQMGLKLGDAENPLLVSVRSGAAQSMPGMMDTILNLGLNDRAVEGLARKTGNQRFAWDAYRRLIDMFGDTAMGVPHDAFEEALTALKERRKVKQDTDLTVDDLKELVARYKAIYRKHAGHDFPQDARDQLWKAIGAVFGSWMGERAIKYRAIEKIHGLLGTAVNVQAMVFGNMGPTSGTGVCLTRDDVMGEKKLSGDYLINAQGEDVVAGIRATEPIDHLRATMPAIYQELEAIGQRLEQHYKDMQDIEFTIQEGRLFILQTRTAKRPPLAAVRVAVTMVQEGLIDVKTALERVKPENLNALLLPRFDPKAKREVIARGVPASPGAATGMAVFTAPDAEELAHQGHPVILCRVETSPEDVSGMHAAQGILTAKGGRASHAALVARGWGRPCVAGCEALNIHPARQQMTVGHRTIKHGDFISIDGDTGEVMLGRVPTVAPKLAGEFATLMEWTSQHAALKVRTNADTPQDARRAREFGAQGIGLCRTEHMFFDEDRIMHFRLAILVADDYRLLKDRVHDLEARLKDARGGDAETLRGELKQAQKQLKEPQAKFLGALKELQKMQRKDFEGILKVMDGLPVTIRLLDPPLHEFLPADKKTQEEMAQALGVDLTMIQGRVQALHELNPMLGLRGCRLGMRFPEITEMQVRAIIEAACSLQAKGVTVLPEIMVPLVGTVAELEAQRAIIDRVAREVMDKKGVPVEYQVGTMIEVPRAALTAAEIARAAEFFSFGTNDLTQLTFGYSRDDVGPLITDYLDRKVLPADPFQTIDQTGVGQLVEIGIREGRKTRPDLKVGICGEHGGDPDSVKFCARVGMNYVSCSPFRVPIARLAAAQAGDGRQGTSEG